MMYVRVTHNSRRMRQKDIEWRRTKREWNRTWGDVYEKNYYKSLDYQSHTFKQNERKALGTKMLLAEIKSSTIHELNFAYDNAAVHRDILELLTYTANQTLDNESAEQVLSVPNGSRC